MDAPDVAARARAHLTDAGVADRAAAHGGSFFEKFPGIFGDCDVFVVRSPRDIPSDESRDVLPRRRTNRGDAAAATWIFRGESPRPRRGYSIPRRRAAANLGRDRSAPQVRGVVEKWDDARAIKILSNLRRAAAPGATLVINEVVLGTNGPRAAAERLADLHMVATGPPGARARTVAEHAHLLHRAGIATTDLAVLSLRSLPAALQVTLND